MENKSIINRQQAIIDTKTEGKWLSSTSKLPRRSEQLSNLTDFIRQAEKQKAINGRTRICTFCKSNGEPEQVYSSHSLKDFNDKITCPILLEYACPVCGAKGEKSHTKKYCPVLQKKVRLQLLDKISVANKEN